MVDGREGGGEGTFDLVGHEGADLEVGRGGGAVDVCHVLVGLGRRVRWARGFRFRRRRRGREVAVGGCWAALVGWHCCGCGGRWSWLVESGISVKPCGKCGSDGGKWKFRKGVWVWFGHVRTPAASFFELIEDHKDMRKLRSMSRCIINPLNDHPARFSQSLGNRPDTEDSSFEVPLIQHTKIHLTET